jgi:hypothetical protein
VSTYVLWTLTPMGEMDRQIATDIETLDDAEELAEHEADERECDILIMNESTGSFLVHSWWY